MDRQYSNIKHAIITAMEDWSRQNEYPEPELRFNYEIVKCIEYIVDYKPFPIYAELVCKNLIVQVIAALYFNYDLTLVDITIQKTEGLEQVFDQLANYVMNTHGTIPYEEYWDHVYVG